MKYEKIAEYSNTKFRRITGIKRAAFDKMVEILRKGYAEKRQRRGRTPNLSIEDLLLATLEYLREYRTYAHIAARYGIAESNIYRGIRWVEDTLIRDGTFSLPGRKAPLKSDAEYEAILVDATESPIERPKKAKSILFQTWVYTASATIKKRCKHNQNPVEWRVTTQTITGGQEMSTSYHHFTTEERESLLKYQVEGLKPSEMARRLKRSRSSISRELRRNVEQDGKYSAIAAERKYRQRRKRCVRKRLLDDPEKKAFVEEKLREYWSPEQIAGRLKATGSRLQVSYSTIYRAIHAGRLEIAKKCLRRKGHKASPHDEETRGHLHGHKTIHDRPRAANTRSQFGQGDTVQGVRGKGALATFVDRRSGFLVACLLSMAENFV